VGREFNIEFCTIRGNSYPILIPAPFLLISPYPCTEYAPGEDTVKLGTGGIKINVVRKYRA